MNSHNVEIQKVLAPLTSIFPNVDIMTPTGYLSAVRTGVTGDKLKAITNIIGDRDIIASAIGKDASNLSKSYRAKRLSQLISDNLIDTLRVYVQAANLYESVELAKEWMNSRIPALGGEVPATLLTTHAGRELVRQTLRKMEFGEFV